MSSAYWQHYRMEWEPFTEGSASSSCYMPLQWEQQMGLLHHLSWHSQVVLLVTGLSGIGKTTLLNQFVQAVSHQYHVLKLQGNETLGPDQLLKLLAERLGLSTAHKMGATLQEQVISQLAVMQSSKQTLLLVVDDAHHLPSLTLGLILNLASPKAQVPTALHGVLFGGPQLEANMADVTSQHLDEDLTHTLRMEPLNLEATDKYLQHGLHGAGYSQGSLPFDETEIIDIYHASGGIPANINRLAQQGLREKVPALEKEKYNSVWLLPWLKSLGAVSIFVLLFWGISFFMAQLNVSVPWATVSKNPSETMQPSDFHDITQNAEHLVAGSPLQDQSGDVPNAEEEVATMDTLPALDPVIPYSVDDKHSSSLVHSAHQPMAVAGNGTDSAMPEESPHLSPIVATPVTASSKNMGKIQPLLIFEKETSQNAAHTLTKAQEKPIKSSAKPSVSHKKHQNAVKTPSQKVKPKFLGNGFTVQLLGTQEAFRAKDFIKRNHLHSGARYYRTQRKGVDWYVVVYGGYSSRAAANAAIKTLPPAVQAQKPWVRSNKGLPTTRG